MNKVKHLLNKKTFNLPILVCLLLVFNTFHVMYNHSGILYLPNVLLYPIYAIEIIIYLLLIIPQLIDKNETAKNKVIFIVLLALSIICGINSKYYLFSYTIATCYATHKEKTEDIIKVLLICVFIGLIGQIGLYYYETLICGAEFNQILKYGYFVRYSFEVGHPNLLALYIFDIQLMFLYANYKNENVLLNTIMYVVLMATSVGTYYLTYSRTVLLISIFSFALFFISNKFKLNKFINFISKWSFVVCCIAFFLITLGVANDVQIANKISSLIAGRPFLTNIALKERGLSPFGQFINYKDLYIIDEDFFIDSIYPYLAIEYGYVWLPILAIMFYTGTKYCDIRECILIIIFSLYGLTEQYGLEHVCLSSIIVLKNIYCDNNKKNKVKIEEIQDNYLIEPDFIYNRIDMFSSNYSVFKCNYNDKTYYVEVDYKDNVAEIGLWMSDIPSDAISEVGKYVLKNKNINSVEYQNYKYKTKGFGCIKTNHFRVNLPNSEEEMAASLSKSAKYTIKRKQKDFIKEFGEYDIIEYVDIPDDVIIKYFELKKITHNIDYNMTPKEYLNKYHVTNAYVMYLKNEIIAILLSCEQCKIANFENFTYDTKYSKYSIGKIIYDEYMVRLISHNVHEVYLGGGDYDYKRRYNSIEDVVYDGVMYKSKIKNSANIVKKALLEFAIDVKHKLIKSK